MKNVPHPNIKVNLKHKDEKTALHLSAQHGSTEQVKLLLAHEDIEVNASMNNRIVEFLSFFHEQSSDTR